MTSMSHRQKEEIYVDVLVPMDPGFVVLIVCHWLASLVIYLNSNKVVNSRGAFVSVYCIQL